MTMPSSIRFFVFALSLLGFMLCPPRACPSEPPKYLARVTFTRAVPLHFPDFDATYAGRHRVTPPQFPRGWWVYDFVVRSKSGEQMVSWSAGTGDIGPVRFEVAGVEFQIELIRSDKLGALRDEELVISKVEI